MYITYSKLQSYTIAPPVAKGLIKYDVAKMPYGYWLITSLVALYIPSKTEVLSSDN